MSCLARCPENISREAPAVDSLPTGWNTYPAPRSAAEFGDTWVREARSVLLLLPSVVVPRERVVLLNPLHPDFARVQVELVEPFRFDPRLLTVPP
jgi:RES domain-containing protein